MSHESPFRVKICGVTTLADAAAAVDAGADALGLNFYSGSKRYVSRETAGEIPKVVAGKVLLVGVFVNPSAAEVAETVEAVGFDAIQLHGDEPAGFVSELRSDRRVAERPVIRAFRFGRHGPSHMEEYVQRCVAAGTPVSAALIDAYVAGDYGGSGTPIDWKAFRELRPRLGNLPLILAGGLTPENVEQAIAAAAPDGVDVASGVESSPGRKDPDKVRKFVANARRALESSQ